MAQWHCATLWLRMARSQQRRRHLKAEGDIYVRLGRVGVVHLALRRRLWCEVVALKEDSGLQEVHEDLDHEEVADEDVEDHRGAEGVPAVRGWAEWRGARVRRGVSGLRGDDVDGD